MSGIDFFVLMGEYSEREEWEKLENLLLVSHSLVMGEREAFFELQAHSMGSGLTLDPSGFHVSTASDRPGALAPSPSRWKKVGSISFNGL